MPPELAKKEVKSKKVRCHLHGMNHNSQYHAKLRGMVIGDNVLVHHFAVLFHDISTSAAQFLMIVVAAVTYPDIVGAFFIFGFMVEVAFIVPWLLG